MVPAFTESVLDVVQEVFFLRRRRLINIGGQNGKPLGFMGYEMITAVHMANRCLLSQTTEALSGREGGRDEKTAYRQKQKIVL